MTDNLIPPPPANNTDTVPDFYLGCLIYYDWYSDDAMKWICYDGRNKVRCISKAAAMNHAQSISDYITDGEIGHLMFAHHFLTRAWRTLDKAAEASGISDRLWLQQKAVDARKIADAIDTLISQKIGLKSKL